MRITCWGAVAATVAVACGTMLTAAPARAVQPAATRLRGSHATWASARNRVGAVDAGSGLDVRVYLQLRDPAGLTAAARAVSDPASPQYGHFLTPAQVRDRFMPAPASVDAVRSWLAGSGLHVSDVAANRQYVEATGTARQIDKTFGVTLSTYRVHGRVLRASDQDLAIPTSLAGSITGVVGVNDRATLLQPRKAAPPSPGFRNGRPCSAYWGQKLDTTDPAYGGGFSAPLPYAPCGYTPPQLRAAYGIASTVDAGHAGNSATVAIIDAYASPTVFSDAAQYATRNDPAHPLKPAQFSQVVYPPNSKLQGPKACDASGWYGEETLDVEAVHAMAPAAKILYVGASDCESGLDKALVDTIAGNRAQIISNSWGDLGEGIDPATVTAYDTAFQQAAVQGIGVYFASGDNGDESADLGKVAADWPGTDPWTTAVGGTSIGIDANGHRTFETGWETGKSVLTGGAYDPAAPGAFYGGSGGGTSVLFAQPAYQKGVVPKALAGAPAARVVPDIAMDAEPATGMLIGQTQRFPNEGTFYDEFRIGGTSLATPLLAGLMAVADDLHGVRHGFVNPLLYGKVRKANAIIDVQHVNAAAVRIDFVNGTNAKKGLITSVRTFDFGGLAIHTTKGYDDTTGLGVPGGLAFLQDL